MHWIEGSGKVLSAVATLKGVAKRRRYKISCIYNNE